MLGKLLQKPKIASHRLERSEFIIERSEFVRASKFRSFKALTLLMGSHWSMHPGWKRWAQGSRLTVSPRSKSMQHTVQRSCSPGLGACPLHLADDSVQLLDESAGWLLKLQSMEGRKCWSTAGLPMASF